MTRRFLLSRRGFCATAAAALLRGPALLGSQSAGQNAPPLSPTHPNVAAIDHDRILAAADPMLLRSPAPLTAFPSPRSPGTPNDFYSEPESFYPDPASATAPWKEFPTRVPNAAAFTAHRDAVITVSVQVATLAAAFVLTADPRYSQKAAEHLRAWFLTPATRMTPDLRFGQRIPNSPPGRFQGRFEGILETVPFAEVAQAIPFLASSGSLSTTELSGIHAWFAAYLQWLTDSQLAGLARDQKDHHGSSWLLQCAAYAHLNAAGLTSDDAPLTQLRHHFHSVTLRAQIHATGNFPHEVTTAAPYRNSLFNLDMLSATCDLLSTRFESAWEYELQDGPGMRAAIAYHVPFIANRAKWPYPADDVFFTDLPGRRPALLLAGRAFVQAEYTALWRSLTPLAADVPGEILRSLPLHQPLLWIARPKPVVPA
jgi:Alginate lyase